MLGLRIFAFVVAMLATSVGLWLLIQPDTSGPAMAAIITAVALANAFSLILSLGFGGLFQRLDRYHEEGD